jgi:hypothetical protein
MIALTGCSCDEAILQIFNCKTTRKEVTWEMLMYVPGWYLLTLGQNRVGGGGLDSACSGWVS